MRPSYLPKTYRPLHCHKVTSASDTNYIPKHLKLANPLPACHDFQSVSFPGCISFLFRGESLWWLELEGIQPVTWSDLRVNGVDFFLPKDLNEAKTKRAAKGLHWCKNQTFTHWLGFAVTVEKKNVWKTFHKIFSQTQTVVKNGGWKKDGTVQPVKKCPKNTSKSMKHIAIPSWNHQDIGILLHGGEMGITQLILIPIKIRKWYNTA